MSTAWVRAIPIGAQRIVETVLPDEAEGVRVLESGEWLFEPVPGTEAVGVQLEAGRLLPSVLLPEAHWYVTAFSLDHDRLILSDVNLRAWDGHLPSVTVLLQRRASAKMVARVYCQMRRELQL